MGDRIMADDSFTFYHLPEAVNVYIELFPLQTGLGQSCTPLHFLSASNGAVAKDKSAYIPRNTIHSKLSLKKLTLF